MDDHADQDDGRSTAPQSDYTIREVGIGIGIMAVGVVITFGLPLAL
jgi:hypothetical protein